MMISFIGQRASALVAKAGILHKKIEGLDPADHVGIFDGNVV
jgi:hypothetical protein